MKMVAMWLKQITNIIIVFYSSLAIHVWYITVRHFNFKLIHIYKKKWTPKQMHPLQQYKLYIYIHLYP